MISGLLKLMHQLILTGSQTDFKVSVLTYSTTDDNLVSKYRDRTYTEWVQLFRLYNDV